MARKTDPGKSVAAKVPTALFEALEDYRWPQRLTMAALLGSILTEWALENTGYVDESDVDE